jgi:prepilin signal peptidase PulO-like enzyme (type II secretory pathway)
MHWLDLLFLTAGSGNIADRFATPLLACVLGWLSWVDWRVHRLPDRGTLPLIGAGLVLATLRQQGVPVSALIGAAGAFALFALLGEAYFRTRGIDGLGLGDAKLFAAAGAWLGWQSLPGVVLLAALIGLGAALVLRVRGQVRLAFGPAISVAFLVHWIVFIVRAP